MTVFSTIKNMSLSTYIHVYTCWVEVDTDFRLGVLPFYGIYELSRMKSKLHVRLYGGGLLRTYPNKPLIE